MIVSTLKITHNCLKLTLKVVSALETDVQKNFQAQLANSTWPKTLDKIYDHTLQKEKFWTALFPVFQHYWHTKLEEFQRKAARLTQGMQQPSLNILGLFSMKREKEEKE